MRRKIAVVDDNKEFLEEISCLLESGGYVVSRFCDGASAVKKIPAIKPDAVVSDVSVGYAEKVVAATLSGLPESLNQEDALLITFELESSIISSIFYRLFYKIQNCIPNDVNYFLNINMSEHITKTMNEIILRSKNSDLKEKAKKEKELWK
ncbi:MAG: response regulator [Elusimicrobiota bacterium]|nr:response regulator [Elusimicrobiota bacterium]